MTTYKTELTVNVTIYEHKRQTLCCFVKGIELPFPPFKGLEIQLPSDEGPDQVDTFTVKEIAWNHTTQTFRLEDEDHQDNRPTAPRPPFSINAIIEYYTSLGWSLAEGEEGPFLTTDEDETQP